MSTSPFLPRALLAFSLMGGLTLPVAAQGTSAFDAATAPEVWLNVGGFSRHFSRSPRYNETNLGVGVELRTSPQLSFMAGAYDNSLSKTSEYAAVNWQPWMIGPVKLGVAVGVLNGYPAVQRGGTFFAALPMASIEGRRFGINLGIIPSVQNVDGALLIQFKLRLN